MCAKRKTVFALFTAAILFLCGCNGTPSNNTRTVDDEKIVHKNCKLENTSYTYGEDGQAELGMYPNTAYTPEGYYSFEQNDSYFSLKYYDYASEASICVCGKANCMHTDETCNAYFSRNIYPVSVMWIYNGSLYMPYCDGEYYNIMKISADGSTREKSCTIERIAAETSETENGTMMQSLYPTIMIHRGYAYYSTYYPGCESCILGRVKLDANEEPEELYKVDGAGADIYRMKPYGDYLFFQAGNYAENNIDFNGGLKFYNVVTGEIDDISDDIITDYVVARDGSVYYERESGVVYKYNDDGNEEFFDTKSGEDLIGLYVDKNTLLVECCAEEYIQYALDFDGNVLNEEKEIENWKMPYQSIRE